MRLRIGIAGNARREIAQIAAERRKRVDLHRDDAAVAVETHAGMGIVIARLCVGQEGIGSGCRPAHRPSQQLRGPDNRRHFDGEISLHAETAADVGRNDANLVFRNMQRVDGQPAAQIVRLLRRGIKRIAVGRGVVFAQIGARLQRIGGEPAVAQPQLDDLGGAGHRGVGLLPVAALDVEDDVGAESLMHQRRRAARPPRANRRRPAAVRNRRDGLGGVLGRKAALGHDCGDDVADVAYLVAGEGWDAARCSSAGHRRTASDARP